MDLLTKIFWQQVDIPILLVLLNLTFLLVFIFGGRKKMFLSGYLLGFVALRMVIQLSYLLSIHFQISNSVLYVLTLVKITSYLLLNLYSWGYISIKYKKTVFKVIFFIPTMVAYGAFIFMNNADAQNTAFIIYKVFTIASGVLALISTIHMLKNSLPPVGHCRTKKTYFTFRLTLLIYTSISIMDLPLISLQDFDQLTGSLYDWYFAKYLALFLLSVTMLFSFVHTSIYNNYHNHHHNNLMFGDKMAKFVKQFIAFYVVAAFFSSAFIIIMGGTATSEVKKTMAGTTKMSSLAISSLEYEQLSAKTLSNETILLIKDKLEKLESSDYTIWAPRIYLRKEDKMVAIGPRHFTPNEPAKIYEKDFVDAPDAVRKIFESGSEVEFEWPYITPDGVFCASFVPITTDDGKLFGVMAIDLRAPFWHEVNLARRTLPCLFLWLIIAFIGTFIKDNQNYQVSQMIAQIDHELLLQTQESAQVGSWITNPHSSKFVWFEGLERILNIPQLGGIDSNESILNFIHPEDRENAAKFLDRTNEGVTEKLTCRLLLDNNEIRYVIISIKSIMENSNKLQVTLVTLQDISQIKLLEEDVVFKKALDKSDLMSVGFKPDGTLIYINDSYQKNIGWSFEEIAAEKWCAHVILSSTIKGDLLEVLNSLEEADNPELSHFEMTLKTKSDETILIEWNGTIIRESSGQVVSISFIGDNITERRKLEQLVLQKKTEAEKANHSKSMFLANMSHEIRTPMNAILGFSEILSSDKSLTSKQREFVSTITRSGEHLLTLINDILEMSKIESGSVTFNPSTIDLHAMITEIKNMFILRANAKGIDFVIEYDDLPRYIHSDESKIRQIAINLLGNAVKFTANGGITWRLKCDDLHGQNCLVMEISDSGVGISEAELVHIFQPFEQSESGKKQGGGTGLGLAISRELARFMNGDIHANSEYGVGTTFKVEVPVEMGDAHSVRELETAQNVISIKGGKRPRILAVDDKEENLLVLRELLEPTGFIVSLARNGVEAIEAFQRESFDLILMDMRMPIMDGYESSGKIREDKSRPYIPIIALTASAFEEDKQRVFASGIDDFIRKPFQRKTLFSVIKKYLEVEYVYEEKVEEVVIQDEDVTFHEVPINLTKSLAEAVDMADFNEALDILDTMKEFLTAGEFNLIKSLIDSFQYEKIAEIMSRILQSDGENN